MHARLKKNIFIFILGSYFFSVATFAVGQEYIKNYAENIVVNRDASITITETISVFANRDKIIHGLVRRLPTRYTDSYGITHYSNYKLQQILINKAPSPYHTAYAHHQFLIYIGNKNTRLSPGFYTYTLQYQVDFAVNFLRDADELYWNVTGNSWDFPIMHANVTVTLPEAATILRYAAYTGAYGAKEQNYSVTKTAANQIQFTTTQPLPSGSGLTVALAWPKGIITPPSWMDVFKGRYQINRAQFIVLEISVLLFIYYLIVWYAYGRDPRKSTIIPLFSPPENLSPAAVRYIMRMRFDMKILTAAIVSMATKGFLTIQNHGSTFTLKKMGSVTNLDEHETTLANSLFAKSNTLTLTEDNQQIINSAKKRFAKSLQQAYKNIYFVTNTVYFLPGLVLTFLAFLAAILSAQDQSDAFFAVISLSIWGVVVASLLVKTINTFEVAYNNITVSNVISTFFSLFMTAIFFGAFGIMIVSLTTLIPIFTVPILFFILVLNIIFYILLKAPTKIGRKLMDQIEGFKLFLGTTERYPLDQLYPPEKTPELFEKYLPYAIALNVENRWGEKFHAVLSQTEMAQTYQPTWYTGTIPFTSATLASFPNYLNSGISSALASSSISGSSSGSGGGGSSGGGGGGGGGGGW